MTQKLNSKHLYLHLKGVMIESVNFGLSCLATNKKTSHTLLHVVDQSLQFWDAFRLFSQGIQDHVIVGRANHVRLPQLALQEPDLSLLLGHL